MTVKTITFSEEDMLYLLNSIEEEMVVTASQQLTFDRLKIMLGFKL